MHAALKPTPSPRLFQSDDELRAATTRAGEPVDVLCDLAAETHAHFVRRTRP
ncbi:hypothetical protein [Polyangium sp. y55x31]|uniref:hypothetical protein n=1 Tax=Polyangium sp. y55x31 TaxID=3042688 RepID=UPI0024831B08|nr:hypothetical protein [Polyangium sp. y55x31]